MSKANFSGHLAESLNGRGTPPPAATLDPKEKKETKKTKEAKSPSKKTVATDKKGKTDKGLGLNKDGTFRQSNAGRKTAEEKEKPRRSQIALTLDPVTVEKLSTLGDGYKKLLNRYIDKNIDALVKELEKL